MSLRTMRKVVLVWPNGREQFVKRSKLSSHLKAVNVEAMPAGHTSTGHECYVVVAGAARELRVRTESYQVAPGFAAKLGHTSLQIVHQ